MSHKKINPAIVATGITVALTSGVLLALSPQVAKAYASADNAAAQIKVLRSAVSDGLALPSLDKKVQDHRKQAYCDASSAKSSC